MIFIRNSNETLNRSSKELAKKSYENINKKDKKGRTILHYAVRESDPKTVNLLIEKGADINAEKKCSTLYQGASVTRWNDRAISQ